MLSDNDFTCTNYVIEGTGTSATIRSRNNAYRGCLRFVGIMDYVSFRSVNDELSPDPDYVNSQLFGVGQMQCTDVDVRDLYLDVEWANDTGTGSSRYFVLNPVSGSVIKTMDDISFEDSASATTSNVAHQMNTQLYSKDEAGTPAATLGTTVVDSYIEYGPDTIAENAPAVVSTGGIAYRRPAMTVFPVTARGLMGFSIRGVN